MKASSLLLIQADQVQPVTLPSHHSNSLIIIVRHLMALKSAEVRSGYEISVDAMTSAIADAAFFSEIMNYQNIGIFKNEATSIFRKRYESLLNDLHFRVY